MKIRFAENSDITLLSRYDKHIAQKELEAAIKQNRVYVVEDAGNFAGWLRYHLFWDNTPFMSMLYICEAYRGQGFGNRLVSFWEKEMGRQGYQTLMTSTQSDEYAQHFYFKLDYEAIGGFRLADDPYELIFAKKLPKGENLP